MTREYKIFLGGEWRSTSQTFQVINPYNNEVVGIINQADDKDMADAINKGAEAFKTTKNLPAFKRAEILHNISNGIKERKEEIARAITLESGKPISDSRVEVNRAINTFQVASEEAKRIYGEVIPLDLLSGSENRIGITKRTPAGLVFGISPFNFPLNLVAHKIAPAIAVGNPIILKPASKTPITALLLGEIIDKSGAVPGSVSITPCSNSAAETALSDDRIKLLSFTGSAAVGWRLKEKFKKKKVVLELGGNAGVIVHSDADIEYAAKRCTVGGFAFSGQVCISVQRIYLHEDIYEKFLDKFTDLVRGLKISDPLDETTNVGPMVDEKAAKRTEEWVNEAVQKGSKVLVGGKRNGNFYEPTILVNTTSNMKVYCEEAFAPIVTIVPYKRFDDAVSMINDSIYGLQAGLFTKDVKNIFYAFNEIEVGGLIVNDAPMYRIDHMPYGGVKESGVGKEGIRYAIESMTDLKFMALNLS